MSYKTKYKCAFEEMKFWRDQAESSTAARWHADLQSFNKIVEYQAELAEKNLRISALEKKRHEYELLLIQAHKQLGKPLPTETVSELGTDWTKGPKAGFEKWMTPAEVTSELSKDRKQEAQEKKIDAILTPEYKEQLKKRYPNINFVEEEPKSTLLWSGPLFDKKELPALDDNYMTEERAQQMREDIAKQ